MEALAWIGAVGGLLGGLGGLAGALAFLDNRKEKTKRQRLALLPPELRPLLIEIIDALGKLERSPRDLDWIEANIEPLRERLEPLQGVVGTIADLNQFGGTGTLLSASLRGVYAAASRPGYPADPAQAAMSAIQQKEMAQTGKQAATTLMRVMSN